MTASSMVQPDQFGLREQFLRSGMPPVEVRDEIAASWRRCQRWIVPFEHVRPPFEPDIDPDGRLLRAASPMLQGLVDHLGDLPISVSVSDAGSRILGCWAGSGHLPQLSAQLHISPGYVLREDIVGTCGVGTAIEVGSAVRIDGAEHYASEYISLTCVGIPIMDATGHHIEGALAVTCPADPGNRLIGVIAHQAVASIESRLLDEHTATERALLAQFTIATRRSHGGVIVMNDRVVFTNAQAARLLDAADQPLMWEHASRVMSGVSTLGNGEKDVVLSSGRVLRMRSVVIRDGGDPVGALIEIRPITSAADPQQAATLGTAASVRRPPGLVGSNSAMMDVYRRGTAALPKHVVVITGEAGVGKLAMARALHDGTHQVIDAATADAGSDAGWLARLRELLAGEPGSLTARHLHLLRPQALASASALLDQATRRGWRCTGTFTCRSTWDGPALPDIHSEQLRLPPLRDRLPDLPALVTAFAAPRRVSPEAMQVLLRLPWPGNIRELATVVRMMGTAAPDGRALCLTDLPVSVRRAAARRPLTRFERAEVHAIVEALADANGDKKAAAALLGISRSTIYRKLRSAGIDLDNMAF
jgi:sigma-54 dependent transcriptional regulator, acetoin dehydrogenase operon transcriptional activator AcoR